MSFARCGALGAVVVAGVSAPGAAAEVWRTPPGALPEPVVVEVSGFVKPYASWLHLPDGLVSSSAALAQVVSDARAELPPDDATHVQVPPVLPQQIGLATQTLRLQGVVRLGDLVELDAAWQGAAVIATSPLFAAGTGTTYLGAAQPTAARRLIDFDPVLLDDGGFVLEQNLDQLALAYHGTAFSAVAGRQVVSWGTGRLWNPTDLFSPFAPTDVDREVRRGADALRVSVPVGEVTELEALWLPQQDLADNGGVLRARTNVFDVDVSATAAKYVDDVVLGGDFSGELSGLEVHGEAAWTLPIVGLHGGGPVHVGDTFVRAVAGITARPASPVFVTAEYYFNGFGTDDPTHIVEVLRSDRVARGEIFGAGRHYLGTAAAFSVNDLTTLTATAIVNLTDPGILLAPSLEHSFEQHVLLRAGLSLPFGAGVDTTLFQALTPADVLANTALFQTATSSFGARSEFGLSPVAAWIQVGLYFG